jgi:hypothetical protein
MTTDEQNDLAPAEFAAILSTTLALAADAHITVGIRNAPANERRPAGLIIYLSGIAADDEGRLIALEVETVTQ